MIEARRAEEDRFAWTVPGFAIAGQAFLLAIVLRDDVTSTARLVASIAGVLFAVGAAHLYGKNVYLFDIYEAFIEYERQRLGLHSVQLDALRDLDRYYPANTQYVQRGYRDRRGWRYRLIVRHKTANVWLSTLAAFVVLDFLLGLYAIVALAGADLNWLG